MWELTLPQLNYYLKQCHEHIDFTVKVSTMGLNSIFGGGYNKPAPTSQAEKREDGEYIDGYKVATAEDMYDFAKLLGA
ncbi:hypothetical protein [Brevibacillus laterosporus]|uniref:hypothetical protein n=1 Tax=Brevibacillus laterosporus TaxID=1465 RepID=UPI003D200733